MFQDMKKTIQKLIYLINIDCTQLKTQMTGYYFGI